MGLLSWLFPSEADKLAQARAQLERGRHNDARLTAMELEGDEAAEIVALAERALCQLNLEHAVSWARAADAERVRHHLELAQQFHQPGLEEDVARAQREIRAIAAEQQAEVTAAADAEKRKLAEVAPGFTDDHGLPDLPVPDDLDDDEADVLKARLALILEGYPEALQPRMVALGADFAQAVLDLDDGKTEEALMALVALPDDEPLVLHERARAASALGDPAAAARAWTAFAKHASGHQEIGSSHTAVLLATSQAQSGDLQGAITTLEAARRTWPDLGGGLYAQLLEVTDRLAESETVWRGLLKTAGTQPPIYAGIARVRVKAGKRIEAMQALETSLKQNDCTPGRCGSRPPDLETHRMLATLYLEDGLETERALELADIARGLVQRPSWEDLYLAALAARQEGHQDALEMTSQLYQATPPEDPRYARLEAHLPAS